MVRGRLAHERDLEDVRVAGIRLLDVDREHARRERDGVDLAENLVVRVVGVYARVELEADDGEAVAHLRPRLGEVVQFGDGVLDRLGDEALDIGRARARVDRHDDVLRERERRVLGARDGDERLHAERDDEPEGDERERDVADGKRGGRGHRTVGSDVRNRARVRSAGAPVSGRARPSR